ncbi:MAG: NAD(P)/FAD-dependent oxidoreductase [Actinomycetes bacterium]
MTRRQADSPFDAVVVGAGAVGSAIARELSVHGWAVALVEARPDVGAGTSKANTAIWHTGFDAKPASLEARLVARGHRLLEERAKTSGWPLRRTGAVLVSWDDDQRQRLAGISANAESVGYSRIEALRADEVYGLEPHLGPGVTGGLLVPDEGLLDPWSITIGLATEAVLNGALLFRGSPVVAVESGDHADGVRTVVTGTNRLSTRWVIDAAGLGSDVVDRLVAPDLVPSFTITPRRGQLIVFDKLAARLVSRIILPVPTATTKGVLVSPTIYGNVLLGPTAEDLHDRTSTQTTRAGLHYLLQQGRRIMPELLDEEVTATYAGLRAATEYSDYCYSVVAESRYVRVAGIRSTGISSALAIAEQVVDDLSNAGERLEASDDIVTWQVPTLDEHSVRPYQDVTRISRDPAYGDIVCHCERVTRGEIRDALATPVPPVDIDGLRRRTRTLAGRCQGFFCAARVSELMPPLDVDHA